MSYKTPKTTTFSLFSPLLLPLIRYICIVPSQRGQIHVNLYFITNFKLLYYAKVQNADQASNHGLSDRNVTSDVHVRTANHSTRCSERPDRRNRYRCQCGAEEHNERYDNGYRWRFLAECAFGCRYSSFIRGL